MCATEKIIQLLRKLSSLLPTLTDTCAFTCASAEATLGDNINHGEQLLLWTFRAPCGHLGVAILVALRGAPILVALSGAPAIFPVAVVSSLITENHTASHLCSKILVLFPIFH